MMGIPRPGARVLAVLLLAISIVPAVTALVYFAFTFVVGADETAVVFRFGQPHREVGPGIALRLPEPVEVVHRVNMKMTPARVTRVTLQPRNFEGAPWEWEGHAYWQLSKATDFLLNAADPHSRIKEAVEAASRDAKFYLSLHGAMPACDLIANAQALLNKDRLGIELLLVCIGGGGRHCVGVHTCARR